VNIVGTYYQEHYRDYQHAFVNTSQEI